MSETFQDIPEVVGQDPMLLQVPMTVLGLSTFYSVALSWLERHYPIKPDHTWAEVAGGVMLTLIPVALTARRHRQTDWRTYEATIWRCFIASGVPIILWQLGESVLRQVDLLQYAAARETRSAFDDADHSTPVASRGRERTYRGVAGSERFDHEAAEGSGESGRSTLED